jgi:hypothetical protein
MEKARIVSEAATQIEREILALPLTNGHGSASEAIN